VRKWLLSRHVTPNSQRSCSRQNGQKRRYEFNRLFGLFVVVGMLNSILSLVLLSCRLCSNSRQEHGGQALVRPALSPSDPDFSRSVIEPLAALRAG
jgi:hypothetical protein